MTTSTSVITFSNPRSTSESTNKASAAATHQSTLSEIQCLHPIACVGAAAAMQKNATPIPMNNRTPRHAHDAGVAAYFIVRGDFIFENNPRCVPFPDSHRKLDPRLPCPCHSTALPIQFRDADLCFRQSTHSAPPIDGMTVYVL